MKDSSFTFPMEYYELVCDHSRCPAMRLVEWVKVNVQTMERGDTVLKFCGHHNNEVRESLEAYGLFEFPVQFDSPENSGPEENSVNEPDSGQDGGVLVQAPN